VIFDGEATTDYIFQYDLMVALWFEERSVTFGDAGLL